MKMSTEKKPTLGALLLIALASLCLGQARAASATEACGEVVTLRTHGGTTMRYALAGPKETPAGDPIALVLLVGGGGDLNLDERGCPRALTGNPRCAHCRAFMPTASSPRWSTRRRATRSSATPPISAPACRPT